MMSLQNEPVTERFEEKERERCENSDEESKSSKANTYCHAYRRNEPDIRGGREADNMALIMNKGSSTEETDAGHDLCSDAGGIGLAPEKSLSGEHGEEA